MIDGKFDIVFRGQIIRGMDVSQVKSNLVSLFKSSDGAVEKLFGGNEVVVRKSLDYATAMKYQSALKKAGALALIKEIVEDQPTASKVVISGSGSGSGRASFGSVDQVEQGSQSNLNKPSVRMVDSHSEDNSRINKPIDASSDESLVDGVLSLAEVGVQIMPDKVYEKKQVDTSELSLAEAGERILPKKAVESHPEPSIDHLSLE